MKHLHDTFRYLLQYKVFRRLPSARSVPLRTRPEDDGHRIEPVCKSWECLKRRSLFRHARLCSRLRGQVFRMCCGLLFRSWRYHTLRGVQLGIEPNDSSPGERAFAPTRQRIISYFSTAERRRLPFQRCCALNETPREKTDALLYEFIEGLARGK